MNSLQVVSGTQPTGVERGRRLVSGDRTQERQSCLPRQRHSIPKPSRCWAQFSSKRSRHCRQIVAAKSERPCSPRNYSARLRAGKEIRSGCGQQHSRPVPTESNSGEARAAEIPGSSPTRQWLRDLALAMPHYRTIASARMGTFQAPTTSNAPTMKQRSKRRSRLSMVKTSSRGNRAAWSRDSPAKICKPDKATVAAARDLLVIDVISDEMRAPWWKASGRAGAQTGRPKAARPKLKLPRHAMIGGAHQCCSGARSCAGECLHDQRAAMPNIFRGLCRAWDVSRHLNSTRDHSLGDVTQLDRAGNPKGSLRFHIGRGRRAARQCSV